MAVWVGPSGRGGAGGGPVRSEAVGAVRAGTPRPSTTAPWRVRPAEASIGCVKETTLDRDPSTRRTRALPPIQGDSGMSRHKDLAFRLAVVAAFVLTLAAPLRW